MTTIPSTSAVSPASLPADVERLIISYRPLLAPEWEDVVGFARDAVRDAQPLSAQVARTQLGLVSRFALWAWQTAGHELLRESMFTRSMIARYVEAEGRDWKTPRRRRAAVTLTKIGNRINGTAHRTPDVAYAEALGAPYLPEDRAWMYSWATTRSTEGRRQVAHALLGFCGGAGLTTSELLTLRYEDVYTDDGGAVVEVKGTHPRAVPIEQEWLPAARSALGDRARSGLMLYPDWAGDRRGMLSTIGARSTTPSPRAHRLRNTWILTWLHRAPVPVVLHLAGVDSIRGLGRHLPYLEKATPESVGPYLPAAGSAW